MFALTVNTYIEDRARIAKNAPEITSDELSNRFKRQTRLLFRVFDLNDDGIINATDLAELIVESMGERKVNTFLTPLPCPSFNPYKIFIRFY